MAILGLHRVTQVARSRCRSAIATMALVALVISGCAAEEVPAAPADDVELVQGREVYTNNCASCHGRTGRGGVGSKLDQGRAVERYPDPGEQIALVTEGVRAMPAFGLKLSEAEIEAVVRYIREIIAASGS